MSATSTPATKTMSSRLLTMKFMQRAATSPTTPTTPDEPSPKRRKTDSRSSFNVDALADRNAIQAAIESEEAKREAALEKQAAEAGDTRWVLSFEEKQNLSTSPPLVLRVISTGFAHLDSVPSEVKHVDELEWDKAVVVGRRSFGKFNRAIEKQQNSAPESSSESEDEKEDSEDSESDDEYDPTTQMIKAERRQAAERAKNERKAKKRAAKAESEQMAKKRKKDNPSVNLNKLTSLSGTRQDRPPVKPPPGITCFTCGGDHFKKDCPNSGKRSHGSAGDDGRPRKAQKHK